MAALKTELLDTLKKFYDELAFHCESRLPNASPPKPVEPWIDFAAAVPKAAITKSRDKDAQEAQLLPKIIQYDPETTQPMNSQEQREVVRTPNASVEVVPWRAWCRSNVAIALGEDMAYQAAITMVLRAHHLAVEEVCQCVEICVDKRTGKRWVRAEKAMEPNELRLHPIAPKTRGYLVHNDHPFRATFTVARCEKAADGGEDVESASTIFFPTSSCPTSRKRRSALRKRPHRKHPPMKVFL